MKLPTYDFSGQVALVTGGASGIGRAAALRFARSGAAVVIVDCSSDAGERTLSEIAAAGGTAHFVATDVSRPEDCKRAVQSALDVFGRLDIAFNNAGIGVRLAAIEDMPIEVWQKTLDINLSGVFHCLQAELRVMRRAGSGVIVNNASVMGLVGALNGAAYSAAKHGVIGLTRTAALDCREESIRVNAICPGFTATGMTGDGGAKKSGAVESAIRRTPMGRMARPEEIAEAAVWLCSDAASYITGVALPVDGGFTAW